MSGSKPARRCPHCKRLRYLDGDRFAWHHDDHGHTCPMSGHDPWDAFVGQGRERPIVRWGTLRARGRA